MFDQGSLSIAAKFCFQMQAQNQKLAEKYIIPIVREVARGLTGIHDAGIIHRDIKGNDTTLYP